MNIRAKFTAVAMAAVMSISSANAVAFAAEAPAAFPGAEGGRYVYTWCKGGR